MVDSSLRKGKGICTPLSSKSQGDLLELPDHSSFLMEFGGFFLVTFLRLAL